MPIKNHFGLPYNNGTSPTIKNKTGAGFLNPFLANAPYYHSLKFLQLISLSKICIFANITGRSEESVCIMGMWTDSNFLRKLEEDGLTVTLYGVCRCLHDNGFSFKVFVHRIRIQQCRHNAYTMYISNLYMYQKNVLTDCRATECDVPLSVCLSLVSLDKNLA